MPKKLLVAPPGGWRAYLLAATNDKRKRYQHYRNSHTWWQRRSMAVKRADGKCALCGNRHHLNVHHLTYERIGQEWPEDLRVVCRSCHEAQHKGATPIPIDERTNFYAKRREQVRMKKNLDKAQNSVKRLKRAEKRAGHMKYRGIGKPDTRPPRTWEPDNSPSIKDRQS